MHRLRQLCRQLYESLLPPPEDPLYCLHEQVYPYARCNDFYVGWSGHCADCDAVFLKPDVWGAISR